MRCEEAIRRHLDDLRWARGRPCDCAAAGHAEGCRAGDMLMVVAIKTLEWALGDNYDIGPTVERIAAERAREGGR